MATTQTTEAHPIPLSPGDWRVDQARSELGFLTRIIFGLIAVRGRYSGFDGELHIDGAGNASGVLRVEALNRPADPATRAAPRVPAPIPRPNRHRRNHVSVSTRRQHSY